MEKEQRRVLRKTAAPETDDIEPVEIPPDDPAQ